MLKRCFHSFGCAKEEQETIKMRVKAIKRIFFCLAVLILAPGICPASEEAVSQKLPLKAFASVDRDKVTIGDKITYILEACAGRDIEIELPEFTGELGGLTVKDYGSSVKTWFRTKTYRQWRVLTAYAGGRYSIPPGVFRYRRAKDEQWQEVSTDEISIEVESVLENAKEKSDIRDIAGPVNFPAVISRYLWIIAVLIALASGAVFFLSKRALPRKALMPPKPAHEIAYEALDALKQKDYLKRRQFKAYHTELSDIARRYLENRFNLRAPEMTTEEFLSSARDNKALSSEQKSLLRDFLLHCDMVKFAKYEPLEKEADLSFESVKKLIDQTILNFTA